MGIEIKFPNLDDTYAYQQAYSIQLTNRSKSGWNKTNSMSFSNISNIKATKWESYDIRHYSNVNILVKLNWKIFTFQFHVVVFKTLYSLFSIIVKLTFNENGEFSIAKMVNCDIF